MVQKSDAMIQHEKWIEWVVQHKSKHTKSTRLLPFEPRQIIIVAATLIVVLMTIVSMQ